MCVLHEVTRLELQGKKEKKEKQEEKSARLYI